MSCGVKKLFVFVCFFLIPLTAGFAQSPKPPEHFYNPPENLNPDPNYTPGDFPLADTNNARTLYHTQKDQLASSLQSDPNLLVTLGAGEIAFTSIKNETKTVLGYFRNYFGVAKLGETKMESLQMVIDINSMDTAVPGRNNRILGLFFESIKPELGTAVLKFTQLDLGSESLNKLESGKSYPAKAEGTLTLNGITQGITAELNIQRQEHLWVVETREPVTLQISDYGFGDRVYELMKSCNHESIGNAVKVNVKLYFK